MCPIEKARPAPCSLELAPSSPGRSVQGLLQRRRMLAAPLRVDCQAADAETHDTPPKNTQGPDPILDQYEILEVLGQGSCGVVRRARRRDDPRVEVALKTVRTTDEELKEIARNEYEMLRSIEHPHVIRALGFVSATDRAVVIMELYDGQPLDRAVKQSPDMCFPESHARALFRQLMLALAYLHRRNIIHRDVKAQNVLVSADGAEPDLRLVDFNVACHLSDGSLTPTGTAVYFAPEILAGQSASEASDIWAAGLCLQLMVAGRLPRRFDTFASVDAFEDAVGRRWSSNGGLSEPCLALLRSCLDADRGSRPSAETLLSAHWLNVDAFDFAAQPAAHSAIACSL